MCEAIGLWLFERVAVPCTLLLIGVLWLIHDAADSVIAVGLFFVLVSAWCYASLARRVIFDPRTPVLRRSLAL